MNIRNLIKIAKLRLSGGHFAKGKQKYNLTWKDLFSKLIQKNPQFEINCVMCGFPRSGTHWIRNVITESSGLYCPNIEDIDYSRILAQKQIPTVKIHARSKSVLKLKMFLDLPPHSFKGKYIYVYRDPRDAIISLYNMYNILKKKNLSQKDFLKIYDPIGQYKWEIKSWVLKKNTAEILVVRFEDLKLNSDITFKQILNFVGLTNTLNVNSLNEFVGVVETNERKKGQIHGWKNTYPEYKVLIDAINLKLEKEIRELNYDLPKKFQHAEN